MSLMSCDFGGWKKPLCSLVSSALVKENPVFRLPFKVDVSIFPYERDGSASFWRSKLILHGVDIQLEEIKDVEAHKEGYVGINNVDCE
jgi:hypothetical protein